ncbi:hypothetical protein KC960_04725 [Candidatus Saccharibacteria bacterium]|nr:hypothetical protein [Candidatus Saccharibacteria bacterium]
MSEQNRFHSASFLAGPEYWHNKGRRIAEMISGLLSEQGKLNYPVILPAQKRTIQARTFSELIENAKNGHSLSSLTINDDVPVVRGFLDGMKVATFPELDSSHILKGLGFVSQIEGIFLPTDYTKEELAALTGGLYLPAIRVDFVPQTTDYQA